MKICTIVGARPQFIKAAPVSRAFKDTGQIEEVVIHTGQHYDENMSKVFFEELEIPEPGYQLGIGSAGHGAQTGRMLEAIEGVLINEKPDWALVYGDTNSTLAGALAACKLHIPVAHVEAGLRSFNRRMPEEINRVLTDHASSLLFAPTETAVANLHNEGIRGDSVKLVGDVMYDAALFYGKRAVQNSRILSKLNLDGRKYILATIHRAENTDNPDRLSTIIEALADVAESVPVILPLHPRTRSKLKNQQICTGQIQLLEPIGYLDMSALTGKAALVCTDSGGLQKEAYFHDIRCLTLRNETEWVELVALGWNRLASGSDSQSLATEICAAVGEPAPTRLGQKQLYGNGQASQAVSQYILSSSSPDRIPRPQP